MKYLSNSVILFICLAFTFLDNTFAQTPVNYTFNRSISIKQSAVSPDLKNPFIGGFEEPQFSPLDLNLDGKLDLLVFDRGTKMFYTFVNDGIPNTVSYTYAPQYQVKLPDCNTFCLTYDYNNDGKMDLFLEESGYIFQYTNTSTTTLSFGKRDSLLDYLDFNIFCPSTNIPSFNDIDDDGDMDILTWDPTGFTIQLFKNWRVEKGLNNNQWKFKLADECWGKFYLDYAVHLGYHCKGIVYYPNGDDYTPPPTPNGTNAHQGSTLLTLDTDSDGDYEALLGDIFYNYLYFLKNGKKEFNYPKDTMIAKDSMYPSPAQRMEVNSFPAAYHLDVDNDGRRDIILAPNDPSGASKNKNQVYFYKNIGTDKKPIFNLIERDFLAKTTVDLGGSSSPTFTDIDKDGDDDMFIASKGEATNSLNSHDLIAYYKNTGTLLRPVFELQDTDFLKLSSKGISGIKPCFGDLNGDGKKDLLFGESNGLLKYYVNTSALPTISFAENTTAFASFQGRNYTAPYLVDFNRDGKLDLFVGNYDGIVSYYQNTGTTTVPSFTKMVDSVGKICVRAVDDSRIFYQDGMSVPVVADLDTDGKLDLLLGGKFGLYLYHNIENKMNDSLVLRDTVGRFAAGQLCVKKITGLYVSPAIAQLDSDSVVFDIVTGNSGGGILALTTYEYKDRTGISSNKAKVYSVLNVLPNPATNSIAITIDDNNENFNLRITDATGKTILTEEGIKAGTHQVSISEFAKGIYFLTTTSSKGDTQKGKFIKM